MVKAKKCVVILLALMVTAATAVPALAAEPMPDKKTLVYGVDAAVSSANGFRQEADGWYYYRNGRIDRGRNDIIQGKVNGQDGWWYVVNGKVSFSAGDYSFAENTSQIIDVQVSGSRGTLTLYNKSGNHFTEKMSVDCYVGGNGISANKVEGDMTTPAGVFTLGQAFGVSPAIGCTRSYLEVNSDYYWVDDSASRYYNQLVDASKTETVWKSAEHLIDYPEAYKYAIAINYNTECVPHKGSAVFLHCSTGSATAGCVAVNEDDMLKILQLLAKDTRIYIH